MKFQICAVVALAIIHYPHAVFPAVAKGENLLNDLADEGIDLKPAQGQPQFLPELSAGEEAHAIVGHLAASGAKLAHSAIKIQSRLVAPLFKIGAKISAPIVKLKAKIAAPFALGGALLSKPFLHVGGKIIAPTVKLAQMTDQKFHKITKPIGLAVADAFSPITQAAKPIEAALSPLDLAVKAGLGDFNFQQQVDNVQIPELAQIDQAVSAIGKNTGILISDSVQALNNLNPFVNNRREKRDVSYSPDVEEIIAEGDDPNFVQSGEDLKSVEMNPTGDPNAEFPNTTEDDQEPFVFPESAPVNPQSQCSASLVGLETSECHRVERYQTRSCLRATCSRSVQNLLDQIHFQCRVSQTGTFCEKNCFSFEDPNLGTCLDCSFSFTRIIGRGSSFCDRLSDCILGSKICPNFNTNLRPLDTDERGA